jgi:hypothetical protein
VPSADFNTTYYLSNFVRKSPSPDSRKTTSLPKRVRFLKREPSFTAVTQSFAVLPSKQKKKLRNLGRYEIDDQALTRLHEKMKQNDLEVSRHLDSMPLLLGKSESIDNYHKEQRLGKRLSLPSLKPHLTALQPKGIQVKHQVKSHFKPFCEMNKEALCK